MEDALLNKFITYSFNIGLIDPKTVSQIISLYSDIKESGLKQSHYDVTFNNKVNKELYHKAIQKIIKGKKEESIKYDKND